MNLKLLSIKEPYATLLAEGTYKTIETRSHRTSYRGPVLIQASKTKDKDYLSYDKLIKNCEHEFQFGNAIAVGILADCFEITKKDIEFFNKYYPDEVESGFWEEGRFAWCFTDVYYLKKPFPIKGSLGMRNVSVSDALLKAN